MHAQTHHVMLKSSVVFGRSFTFHETHVFV